MTTLYDCSLLEKSSNCFHQLYFDAQPPLVRRKMKILTTGKYSTMIPPMAEKDPF
jgi:hypothetical protein